MLNICNFNRHNFKNSSRNWNPIPQRYNTFLPLNAIIKLSCKTLTSGFEDVSRILILSLEKRCPLSRSNPKSNLRTSEPLPILERIWSENIIRSVVFRVMWAMSQIACQVWDSVLSMIFSPYMWYESSTNMYDKPTRTDGPAQVNLKTKSFSTYATIQICFDSGQAFDVADDRHWSCLQSRFVHHDTEDDGVCVWQSAV